MLVQKADGSEPELLDGVKKLLPIVQSGQDILQVSPPSPILAGQPNMEPVCNLQCPGRTSSTVFKLWIFAALGVILQI